MTNSNTNWWLRSANSDNESNNACYVNSNGNADNNANVDNSDIGVRPICLMTRNRPYGGPIRV